jgi:hypothetical protein
MATIGTTSHSSYLNTPRISYITTTAFQNDIFRYTTSVNPTTFVTTGTLTSLATVGTATAANCPANRILRENGKKLYPGGLVVANNTTYGAPNPGVTTYMVGVYDPISFLSGFIDPNSKVFAPYNQDKPEYVARGINPNGNTEVDQGPPVYTLGTVTAGAGLGYSTPSTGSTVTQLTDKGTTVVLNAGVGRITTAAAALAANTNVSFTLTNSFIAATDMVLVQHLSGGTLGTYSVFAAPAAGSATITLRNITGAGLSEAVVIQFTVIKNTA